MATSRTVVTLEDIISETSEMRLKLKKKGESLVDQDLSGSAENGDSKRSYSDDEFKQITGEYVANIVRTAEARAADATNQNKNNHAQDKKAKQEATEKNKEGSTTGEYMEYIVRRAEARAADTTNQNKNDHALGLDEKEKQEAIQKNIEEFDAISANMVEDILSVAEMMRKEMIDSPPHIQPQIIGFWKRAHGFLGGILEWLSSMFKRVLEKLRQGFRIIKNAIKGIFDTVCGFLGNIFKKKERKSEEPTTDSAKLSKKNEQKISFGEAYSRKKSEKPMNQRRNPMSPIEQKISFWEANSRKMSENLENQRRNPMN